MTNKTPEKNHDHPAPGEITDIAQLNAATAATTDTVSQHATDLAALYARLRNQTDGCTAAPTMNFRVCCYEHDLHYRENPANITRAEADARLRRCIAGKNHAIIAWVYWLAVRIFGRPAWKK